MDRDLFANLPQEIAINILLRLPFTTIINCRCVCKAWRHLLSTPEFVDYHYSKSLPGLILSEGAGESSSRYKILEFVDSARDPCNTVCDFRIPQSARLHSSANGLLLFLKRHDNKRNLFVCNPLTREYIDLPPPPTESYPPLVNHGYGFGVSKVSGEYKVVRISFCRSLYKFEVYTLGTGSWRSLTLGGDDNALPYCPGVFLDGKLYSLVKESCLSCFDLETEVLSIVSCPSSCGYETLDCPHLCALGGRLCLCLNDFDELVIWVMHEVGHWTKEFVICEAKSNGHRCETFSAVKVLGEGKIMLVMERAGILHYYSRKKKMKRKREPLKLISVTRNRRYIYRVGYTPSFLSLKTFANENVCSF